jgi:acyl carrier protein
MNVEQNLLVFIKQNLARPEVELAPDTSLIGVVDSQGIIELVVHIADAFGLDVETDAITPENFGSIRQLTEYIQKNAPPPR